MQITVHWVTVAPWMFHNDDDDDVGIRYLPSDDIDDLGICVHRVPFSCLEIKSLNIPAMKRAQGNSFLK